MMEHQHKRPNPWLGLKTYREGEVIYGRDVEIRELSQSILMYRDIVLYGHSGIGKSSIINAGIIPVLRLKGFTPIYIRLSHKEDDVSYLSQIKAELELNHIEVRQVVPPAGPEPLIWEFFHCNRFYTADGEAAKLIFIFDQFEEIFTLQQKTAVTVDFFRQMADLLNDVQPVSLSRQATQEEPKEPKEAPEETPKARTGKLKINLGNIRAGRQRTEGPQYVYDNDIHFIFTLREDFLSDFEYFTSKIPSLRQHRYGLRPIIVEQAASIIMKPRPGLVDKDVAKLIIQKVTGRADFELDDGPEIDVDSAVLSLYLNRIYEECDGTTITADLVEQKGGEIISDFYGSSVADIPEEVVTTLEDTLITSDGRRENRSLDSVLELFSPDNRKYVSLLIKRQVLRRFQYSGSHRLEFIHDILCPVIKKRIDNREMVRRQALEHKRLEEERLRIEEQNREILRRQHAERRRFTRIAVVVGTLILLAAAAWLANWYLNVREYSEYYAAFTRDNGWPIGMGRQLSEDEARGLSVAYRLSRPGKRGSHFTTVEVMSPNGVWQPDFTVPLVGDDESNDEAASKFYALNLRTRVIRFSPESNLPDAPVGRELYYDGDNKPLYGVNYFRSSDKNGENGYVTAVYVDSNGLPMRLRDNGADRMMVMYAQADNDSVRLERKYLFFDSKRNPCDNDEGAYGYEIRYNADRQLDSVMILDPFGLVKELKVLSRPDANSSETRFYTVTSRGDTTERAEPYSRSLKHIRPDGLVAKTEYFALGNPAGYEEYSYDDMKRKVASHKFDARGKEIASSRYHYPGKSNSWDGKELFSLDSRDSLATEYKMATINRKDTLEEIEYQRSPYKYYHMVAVTSPDKLTTESRYYDRNGRLTKDNPDSCAVKIETVSHTDSGKTKTVKYFDTAERPVADYAVEVNRYDRDDRLRHYVAYDANGEIVKSMGYDYKDGIEVARYVVGVDGVTPIRCPQWETDGMTYYKLYVVYNADPRFNLSYVRPASEYGDVKSLAYITADAPPAIDYDPITTSLSDQDLSSTQWQRKEGLGIVVPGVPADCRQVDYLHITALDGAAMKAGLRDGDLPLSVTRQGSRQTVKVMRYLGDGHWEYREATVPVTDSGMEIYPVNYTPEEYAFYKAGKEGAK